MKPNNTSTEKPDIQEIKKTPNLDDSNIQSSIAPDLNLSQVNASIASFVNPTETAGEEDNFNTEMIFNNKAILKMMGAENTKELHGLLMKPLFVNRDHGNTLGLFATTNSRYSDSILGQAYIFERKNINDASSKHYLEQSADSFERAKIICFQRHEVIFNGKKCIVINLRDLSEQECLFISKEKTKQLQLSVTRLSSELVDPLETIKKETEIIIDGIR